MVINGSWHGRAITLSIKPNSLTVSLATDTGADVLSYDMEGRLWTAMLDGVSYRSGLDGKMVAKWQTGRETRERCWVQPREAFRIKEQARLRLKDLYAAIASGEATLHEPLPESGRRAFERAIAFDEDRARADMHRYHQVYRPVGILPPDQYMAVVLQATEGCAFNTCTFCDFYRDRRFRIKRPDEFREHAQAVRDFLGEGLSLRRTIFLGDANALIAPMPRLLPLVDAAHEVYDVERLGGIYAFLDGFSGEKKTPKDYAALAERGLQRVYVGMESGSDPLLRFLKKPGAAADALRAVNAMKEGGVAVGVIVLLGAGGHTFAGQHVRETIRLINAMHLDMHDLIYFSELVTAEGMEYVRDAYQAHLKPLTAEERIAQGEQIEAGLKFSYERGEPHISRYDIREFVY